MLNAIENGTDKNVIILSLYMNFLLAYIIINRDDFELA